jgi:hypothetical protein
MSSISGANHKTKREWFIHSLFVLNELSTFGATQIRKDLLVLRYTTRSLFACFRRKTGSES